ncbi:MAG TPA: DedA family protein [Solirubrobacteraceae bacterium]|nr:DedA family protein [Solirubrobacteraceae bacterium]
MFLSVAAISGILVTIATHVIRSLGYAGIGLLVGMSAVVAVPGTELPMLFAGFNVYQHHLGLPGIIIAGVLGDVIGASVAYAIGRFASVELIERHGAKFHARPEDLERAHRWFERYGSGTMLVSRWLPVVRAAFPYAAGVARMTFWRFFVMTTIGSIVWISAFGLLGKAVGHQWQAWKHHLDYVDYAGIAILVVLIIWGIVRWVRRAREDEAAARADVARD